MSAGREGEGAGDCDRPGGITCEEALRNVYEYLDGELDGETRERVHQHVEVCRRCYPFFNFERLFLDYVGEKGLSTEHKEELEEKVLRLLEDS
jgi:anti-sigma factor (TIGR02949 family)